MGVGIFFISIWKKLCPLGLGWVDSGFGVGLHPMGHRWSRGSSSRGSPVEPWVLGLAWALHPVGHWFAVGLRWVLGLFAVGLGLFAVGLSWVLGEHSEEEEENKNEEREKRNEEREKKS